MVIHCPKCLSTLLSPLKTYTRPSDVHGCPMSTTRQRPVLPGSTLYPMHRLHFIPRPCGFRFSRHFICRSHPGSGRIYSCPDRLPALPNYNLTQTVGLSTNTDKYILPFVQYRSFVPFAHLLPLFYSVFDPVWNMSGMVANFASTLTQ